MNRFVFGGLALLAACDRHYGQCYGVSEVAETTLEFVDGVPVFDWELGTAYAVSVYELEEGDLGRSMWHVQCGGDNLEDDGTYESNMCIEAPLTYGEPIESEYFDTVNFTRPKALEPGVTYQFRMATLTEDEGPPPPPTDPSPLAPLVDWLPDREERDDPHCGALHSAEVDFVLP
ncbi:MAG: hypothetical protein ABMA64_31605 [Myxococcota bacterium]